jgi:hypothetical protein
MGYRLIFFHPLLLFQSYCARTMLNKLQASSRKPKAESPKQIQFRLLQAQY